MNAIEQKGPSRRSLLGYGAALAGGTGLGAVSGCSAVGSPAAGTAVASVDEHPGLHGTRTLAFHGVHQAGITTPPQSYAAFVAFDLAKGATKDTLRRVLRIWTDDAVRITSGKAPLADTEPELASAPARLTATVGVGPRSVKLAGAAAPAWLRPLPAFPQIDRLEPQWSDGDLLLHLGSDDLVTLSHALRVFVRDSRPFAVARWVQRGFRRAVGSETEGLTMRNLMGQVDGTQQPAPAEYDKVVWIDSGPQWLQGGTSVVIRRIRFDLDPWDTLDASGKEQVIGRRLNNGAPLTGKAERDPIDLEAKTPGGLLVVPEFAHVRRARLRFPAEQMLRRGYNYDDAIAGSNAKGIGVVPANGTDTGLIFVAYQADVDKQYVPIQRDLAELDLLNKWTFPIGSAVFAMLPGCAEGDYLGQALIG